MFEEEAYLSFEAHDLVPCGVTEMLPSTESVVAFIFPVLMVRVFCTFQIQFNKWHPRCSF